MNFPLYKRHWGFTSIFSYCPHIFYNYCDNLTSCFCTVRSSTVRLVSCGHKAGRVHDVPVYLDIFAFLYARSIAVCMDRQKYDLDPCRQLFLLRYDRINKGNVMVVFTPPDAWDNRLSWPMLSAIEDCFAEFPVHHSSWKKGVVWFFFQSYFVCLMTTV